VSRRLSLAAALGVCIVAASSGAGSATPRTAPTAAANKLAAGRDAQHLLTLAQLPPGAVKSTIEPAGDGGVLSSSFTRALGLLVDRHEWWTVQASLPSVVAFLQSHPPAGSKLSMSGQSGGPGVPPNQALGFSLRPVAGVISARSVLVEAVALRGGATGIRIDAQDTWMLPRPAGERVPAGVHVIEITSGGPRGATSLMVTRGSTVRRIISLIDTLPIVQPGAVSCPNLMEASPTVTFVFPAGLGKRVLARASVTLFDGLLSTSCNPMSFSVRGRAMKPLLGGTFLKHVQRLLHVRLG
jgi:hypothetical protein